MSLYDLSAKNIKGEDIKLEEYKNNVLIIVNTASKCGLTPQYDELQTLYEKYNEKGLVILGFPCNQFMHQEPGSKEEIEGFCKLNYGVSFPLFDKIDVNGKNAHQIFKYLIEHAPYKDDNSEKGKIFKAKLKDAFKNLVNSGSIKWNFTKFLIDREGNVVKRFEPYVSPSEMEEDIKKLL
jgi:glutathione peroxidase